MKAAKKIGSFVLSAALLLPFAAVPLTASALSVEEAVQCGLKIANDDTHGYSQASRWGPDYDCSSFVITSLGNAGFETGGATYTGNMKKELCKNGFKWYPWDTIKDESDLKRGDILLDEDYHTEFYIGRGQCLGAYNDKNNPQTGDQTGGEICVCPLYGYKWDGVLRYTNDIPKVVPSDLELYAYGNSAAADASFPLTFFSINSAQQLLSVSKDGKEIDKVDVTNTYSGVYKFPDRGMYTITLIAKNAVGEVRSDPVAVKVYKDLPNNLTISADKTEYKPNEQINIEYGFGNAEHASIWFDDYGWSDVEDAAGKETITKSFSEPGDYYITLVADNPVGRAKKELFVTVCDSKPDDQWIWSDNYNYLFGENVTLRFEGEKAASRTLDIDLNGSRYDSVDVTGLREYTFTPERGGEYTCTVTGRNSYGTTESSPCTLKVYKDKPGVPVIVLKQDEVAVSDRVYAELKMSMTQNYILDITNEDGSYHDQILDDYYDYCYLDLDKTGVYTLTLTAENPLGSTVSQPVQFTVYDESPCEPFIQADKELYCLGDEVTLDFGARYGDYLVIDVSGFGYSRAFYGRELGDTLSFFPKEPGVYTYSLTAENYYGSCSTDVKTFSVYDDVPHNVTVTTDKTAYKVGQTVTFISNAECDTERYLTVCGSTGEPMEFAVQDEFKKAFDEPGVYTYSVTSQNYFGTYVTKEGTFTVYDEKPEILSVSQDKQNCIIGEDVVISFETKNAEESSLTIYLDGNKLEEIGTSGLTQYTFKPEQTGKYEYSLYAKNAFGSCETAKKSFVCDEAYTVSYDANGGEGAPEAQLKPLGEYLQISFDAPTREGYDFLGWSTDKDARFPMYTMGSNYTADAPALLYAVWNPEGADCIYCELTEWLWDGENAKAVFTEVTYGGEETDDEPHTFTMDAEITKTVTEPDFEYDGICMLEAFVHCWGSDYYEQKELVIPKLVPEVRFLGWRWEGLDSAYAVFGDDSGILPAVTYPGTVTSQEISEKMQIKYSATAEIDGREYSTERLTDALAVGDADNDGVFTAGDALEVLRASVSGEELANAQSKIYDVNGDGAVTSEDALELLRYSAGMSEPGLIGTLFAKVKELPEGE